MDGFGSPPGYGGATRRGWRAGLRRRLSDGRWAVRHIRLLSLALPLLLLAALAALSWRAERARAVEQVLTRAELARDYLLRVIQAQDAMLAHLDEIVAAARLAGRPLASLAPDLARLRDVTSLPSGFAVVGADGRVLASSNAEATGADVSDRAYLAALRDPDRALFVGRETLRPTSVDALVFARRSADAARPVLLVSAVPVTELKGFLARLSPKPGASAALLRADGLLLVRDAAAGALRLPPDAPALRAVAAADGGIYEAVSDGVARVHGFARIGALPLYAQFGMPEAELRARWLNGLVPVAALLLAAGLFGYLALNHAARVLSAEDRRRAAEEVARRAADRLADARREAELHATLLRELHHRVKNSLSIMQAFARMRGGDERALERRILALGRVHELLHVSGRGSRLDLAGFLRSICASPLFVPSGRVAVELHAEPVEIEVERATPVALAVGELLSNAMRHAFPDGRAGRVSVALDVAEGKELRLVIRDDGVGRPEGLAEATPRSGLGLAALLARRAGGTLALRDAHPGTEAELRIPLAPPPAGAAG